MTRMTTTEAEWGTYGGWVGKREVATSSDVLSICAEVESHPNAGRVLLGFTAPSGHFFAIGLGHDHSCVMYSESVDPPYFQSRGLLDGAEPIDFAYNGHHTEVPATSLISREAAFRALVEFVETGGRPESADWEET